MYSPSQISQLIKTANLTCPPALWRILQSIDQSYSLEYSYISIDPQFSPVLKKTGQIKNYKSLKAVFSDIEKVTQSALIQFEFSAISIS